MGKRWRIPQQKDKLVGHRDNTLSVIQGGKAFETPKHNTRWLTKTKHYWKEYWDSDLASTAQKVDFPAFYRLFQYYDEVERANRVVQSQGSAGLLGTGSKGQAINMKSAHMLHVQQAVSLPPSSCTDYKWSPWVSCWLTAIIIIIHTTITTIRIFRWIVLE